MYYSDGYFKENPNDYQDYLSTLATQLADSSTTYKENGSYAKGDINVKNALASLGFSKIYTSDTYTKKPTANSIACAISSKDLVNMKYKYLVDITVRSGEYEAEWISNVTLGKTGEAQGFREAADQVYGKYFNEYLNQKPEIKEALKDGNVAFYINGFSRGAATANLTAKRLIDEYQDEGNQVFAYYIEAPQGGVKEEIKPNRNYDSIHSIINPNDLVCYVAPKEMGFIRYGVDHYIYGEMVGKNNYGIFSNTPSDNIYDVRKYDDIKAKTIAELKKMLNTDNVSNHEPYDVDYKKLDLRNKELKNDNSQKYTFNFINLFFNKLMYKNGKQVIDRNKYAEKIEPAVKNMMTFLINDPNFNSIDGVDNYGQIISIATKAIFKVITDIRVSAPDTTNPFVIAWRVATGSDKLIYSFKFDEAFRKRLAGYVKDIVASQTKLTTLFDN